MSRGLGDVYKRQEYLIKNNYYSDKLLEKYSMSTIESVRRRASKSGFQFQSYMSANKFYEGYALKSDDGKEILEDYEDKVTIVALTLADGNPSFASILVDKIVKQEFQPATPTFLNAGRARAGEMVSCFLLNVEDSCEGISYAVGSSNHLSKIGGGVANFWSL